MTERNVVVDLENLPFLSSLKKRKTLADVQGQSYKPQANL